MEERKTHLTVVWKREKHTQLWCGRVKDTVDFGVEERKTLLTLVWKREKHSYFDVEERSTINFGVKERKTHLTLVWK